MAFSLRNANHGCGVDSLEKSEEPGISEPGRDQDHGQGSGPSGRPDETAPLTASSPGTGVERPGLWLPIPGGDGPDASSPRGGCSRDGSRSPGAPHDGASADPEPWL